MNEIVALIHRQIAFSSLLCLEAETSPKYLTSHRRLNQLLIHSQRVEKSASPSGNVHIQ
jgi:hypothetical protein